MWFNQYPYLNVNDLNLDYLLRAISELRYQLENFININTIKYANPIQWNITTQYEANTVVIDPNDGTAYLSVRPVPSGVTITNTDYWTPIFTLDIMRANQNITLRDDGSSVLSTFASVQGDWLLWNGTLYKVSQAINVNEAYVVGYNIDRYTVELFIKDYITAIINMIGDLNDLTTTDKTNIVAALNEIVANIGDLNNLTTTDKTNIVAAINEIINTISSTIGDLNNLTTTDKSNVVAAINEITSEVSSGKLVLTPEDFGAVGDGVTDDTVAFQAFIDALIAQQTTGFMRGVYAISSTINIDSGYFNLYGKSDQAKILMTSDNIPVFLFEEGHYISNIIFDSFQIFYANLQTTSLEGSAFKIMSDEGIYQCSFTNIGFYNVFYAFYTPDNHTTMWGCYLNNIKVWTCFAGVVKMPAYLGIPNNVWGRIFVDCKDCTQRSVLFDIRGYNFTIDAIEVLNAKQTTLIQFTAGCVSIGAIKAEWSVYDYTATQYLFRVTGSDTLINIGEVNLTGSFTRCTLFTTYGLSGLKKSNVDIGKLFVRNTNTAGVRNIVTNGCNVTIHKCDYISDFTYWDSNYVTTSPYECRVTSLEGHGLITVTSDFDLDPLVYGGAIVNANCTITIMDTIPYVCNNVKYFFKVATGVTLTLKGKSSNNTMTLSAGNHLVYFDYSGQPVLFNAFKDIVL